MFVVRDRVRPNLLPHEHEKRARARNYGPFSAACRWIGLDFRHPEPVGSPADIIPHFLPFPEVARPLDLTHKDDQIKGKRDFTAVLNADQPEVVARKELRDHSVVEEIRILTPAQLFIRLAHSSHLSPVEWIGQACWISTDR